MLVWNKQTRRGQNGSIKDESLIAALPHQEEATIHHHIHYPGKVFLTCRALGLERRPLGECTLEEAASLAEEALVKTLEQRIERCNEILSQIREN